MYKTKVKKEKVIKEFRNELKFKGYENKKKYEEPFFKILNHVYKYCPNEIKCHISRLDTLTFLIIIDQKYIYIEWSEQFKFSTLLSITTINNDFDEEDGIFSLNLDDALKKIDDLCKKKI